METDDFRVCCHGLAEALGRRDGEGAGATFLLGVGEGGALFYWVGHTAGGQFTSVFGERVTFCPFCGRGVGGDAVVARALPRLEGPGEEVTRWRLGERSEVETVLAALTARGPATPVHINEF